ncbi:hypothetical protein [Salisediminibacterium selenitireducens]|uniref:Uncharacterized protein n=1 Tax=Bacillus selenitireducens (strain ATCC 700615 / DSM 15326 / MLS10) TaxID=439292 RepID=D6XVN9_BACIE|nr:hypothetical protein [Salisediminibacterium selenitireducens]ADH97662.1 hypothetical protein Bsel_0113 [[Bacillus] selenitireducens MLS10]
MGIHDYYKQAGRAYFYLAAVSGLLFVVFFLLYFVLDQGPLAGLDGLILLGVMAVGFLITGFVKRNRSVTPYPKGAVADSDHDLHSVSRVVIAPLVHLLREYQIFSLDGKKIAEVRDVVTGWRRYRSFILELMGIRMFFPKTMEVATEDGVIYRLEKYGGFHEVYELYTIEGTQIASFRMNVWNPFRTYATIHDRDGKQIGENDGGLSGQRFIVKDQEGNRLVELKHQGIPMEALELFSGVNGDLVDISQDRIDEELRPVFIMAPILVKLHFRK